MIDGGKSGALVRNAMRALLKFLTICFCPPVAQISLGIELASLIVEAVRQLMSDDRANGAEIDGVIHALIKERRLQNAGREHNLIPRTAVISVHRRRRHTPLIAVERLTNLRNLPPRFKLVCA